MGHRRGTRRRRCRLVQRGRLKPGEGDDVNPEAAHLTLELAPGAELENFALSSRVGDLAQRPPSSSMARGSTGEALSSLFLRQIDSSGSRRRSPRRVAPRTRSSRLTATGLGFQSAGALKRVAVSGGAPVRIASWPWGFLTGASWSSDDRIAFVGDHSRYGFRGGSIRRRSTGVDDARPGSPPGDQPSLSRVLARRTGDHVPGWSSPLDGPWHQATTSRSRWRPGSATP